MKKALLMSSLMVAFASAGLSAQDESGTEIESPDSSGTEMEIESDGGETGQDMDHAQMFMELDTDADGALSQEEADAATDYPSLSEQFDDLDQDGNGELSMEEFQEFEPEEGEGQSW